MTTDGADQWPGRGCRQPGVEKPVADQGQWRRQRNICCGRHLGHLSQSAGNSVGLQDSGTKRECIRQYTRPVVTTTRRSLMTVRGLPSRPWRAGLRSGPDPRAPQPLSRNGRRTGRTSARCRWRMPVSSLGAWVRRPRRCVHGRDPGHGAAIDDIIFLIGQNGACESVLVFTTLAHPCLGPRSAVGGPRLPG